jgi:hypothetical protein
MKDVFYPANYQNVVKGQPVVVGQKVYCGLYGGNYGIVMAIHGAQKPASIGSICGVMATGGNAYFDIVFDDHISHKLPECILHGVQWKIFPDVASADDILDAIAICNESMAKAKAEAEAKAKAHSELCAKIKAENPHLTLWAGSNLSPGKCAAKNIRIELKAAFPKVKFSVTSEYSCVRISYENGPSLKKVKEICDKYQGGHFDGMQDIYVPSDSAAWADVFGGPDYVFASREVTDDNIEAVVDGFESGKKPNDNLPKELAHGGKWKYYDIANDIVKGKDIPVGQKVIGLKRSEEKCGSWGEMYDLVCAGLDYNPQLEKLLSAPAVEVIELVAVVAVAEPEPVFAEAWL